LLRAIQEKKIRPVGEQNEIDINIRLLSATHKNLNKMVDDGEFRQDLFYRINVIELITPTLRARSSDIPELANYLLAKLAIGNGQTQPGFSKAAINALENYSFPGNVRELENILERALALYEGDTIEPADLNISSHIETTVKESFNPSESSLEDYLEKIEKDVISHALEENRWNKTATAKYLGLTFRSLRYRLKKLGLD
jgi:two-component system response regulator PilR (NtrC family)